MQMHTRIHGLLHRDPFRMQRITLCCDMLLLLVQMLEGIHSA